MNGSAKIHVSHLQRQAVVYLRQSNPKRVLHNRENAVNQRTLADADGIYNPRDFNDRLLLGLKGSLGVAELHSLRLRLDAGRPSKAHRGELVHHLPTGLIRDIDGSVQFHPDDLAEAMTHSPQAAALSPEMRAAFADVGQRLPDVWPQLSNEACKKLLRTLVTGVNRGTSGAA